MGAAYFNKPSKSARQIKSRHKIDNIKTNLSKKK